MLHVLQSSCHVNSMLSLYPFRTPNKVLLSIGRKIKKKGKAYSMIKYLKEGKFSLTSYCVLQAKLSKSDYQKKSEKSEGFSRTITHYFSSSSGAAENICTRTFLDLTIAITHTQKVLITSLAYVDKQGKYALQNHRLCNLHET